MDPQQRWMLELTWEALEDAGLAPSGLRGSSTGVFVGVSNHDYQTLVERRHARSEAYTATGGQFSIIPNRVSYHFDWRGPSLAIDTACSSSLVALDAAVKALQRGDCAMAIAGGANLCCIPGPYLAFDHAGMLSKDGRCKAFDRSADGYVRGEGAGLVLLKPLARAVADGDRIHAVVRATAVNHGGVANSLTAPNPGAQAELLVKAYRSAGVPPSTVGYIEAHGTGTKLGDPIEVAGLKRAFSELAGFFGDAPAKAPHCVLGSVKANIGHLESAAGIAGVIKTVLAIRHRMIPGLLHFEALNPHIELDGSPFLIATETAVWPPVQDGRGRDLPRRAGVSSFGFGGANAHAVLEEWPDGAEPRARPAPRPELVLVSARSPERLREMAAELERVAARLACGNPEGPESIALLDLAYTLRTGRESMESRLALVAADLPELARQLRSFLSGEEDERTWSGSARKGRPALIDAETGEEDRRFLADLVAGRKLAKLASLWASGISIGGSPMPRDGARIVSLPTYRFARDRYWISGPEEPAVPLSDGAPRARAHRLIDSRGDAGGEKIFRRKFATGDALWSDHRVASEPVLPAAVILEIARAAGSMASAAGSVRGLRHVVITGPFRGSGADLDVELAVSGQDDALHFEARDRSAPGAALRAQGKFMPASAGQAQGADLGRLDLAALRQRCSLREAKAGLYAGFKRVGLDYGPAYQVIEELWGAPSEALSRLRLPAAAGHGWEGDGLAPSLLDGALQTVLGIGDAEEPGGGPPFVPFSIDELEIAGFLPSEAFAHAVLLDEGKGSRTFGITISDADGRVLVAMRRVVLRRTAAAQIFRPAWRPLECRPDWGQPGLAGPLVALVATGERLEAVSERWRAAGRRQPVIGVGRAHEFRRLRDDYFELNPVEPRHFGQLWDALKAEGRLPAAILNLWTWGHEPGDGCGPGVDEAIGLGAGAAFLGLQALMRSSPAREVRWVQVCREGLAATDSLNRMLSGFARTLHVEQRRQRCKLVRFSPGDDFVGALLFAVDELAEPAAHWSPEVRSGGGRWVRASAHAEPSPKAPAPLRKRGIYVIAGGAGGLGLILARGLAQRCEARIVLIGRSELDPGRSRRLDEIRKLGSEIRYESADVLDRGELDAILGRVRTQWGPISGVIQGAGAVEDALIPGKSKDAWDRVLAPKVHGTLNLDAATSGDPLDWFVMFSSVIAELGNAGQCDYAAANAFMDAYAEARESLRGKGLRSGRTVSIGWPWWQEGGMAMSPASQEALARSTGLSPLSTAAGVEAFFHALQSGYPHVVVATGDMAKVRRRLGVPDGAADVTAPLSAANGMAANGAPAAQANGAHPPERPANGAAGNGSHAAGAGSNGSGSPFRFAATPVQRIESKLVEIVSALLKVRGAELDLDTDLGDYGVDSVSLMELVGEIEKAFDLVIEPSVLTQHSSLARLSRHLSSLVSAAGPATGAAAAREPRAPEPDPAPGTRAAKPAPAPSRNGASHVAEPIAVVGAAGRFADSADLEEFWTHLRRGDHLVSEVPADRWSSEDYYSDDPKAANKTCSKWGSFLSDIDAFDADFFGIKEEEAAGMDPQQRILLELTQELFDRSGYSRSEVKGRSVAVFLGVAQSDYLPNRLPLWPAVEQRQVIVNQLPNMAAARLSDFFHLRGPAMSLDTACSASLVALHQACQSLRVGECEMAVAGGIQLLIDPSSFVGFSQAGVLSRSGMCAVFDRKADGMVLGEGAGLVLLKRMSRALDDGDRILATILGSAVNNDGHTMGLTTPSLDAQQEVIAAAYANAGIEPSSVTYLEAHGTGTALGDPIEIKAASQMFRASTAASQFCAVGSVKSNLGHLLRAAGIAGFLKILGALESRTIPPTLHCSEPHPRFRFAESPFYPATQLQEWRPREGVRRAGISAFGFGGTNCHLLVEEFDPSARGHTVRRSPLPSTVFHRKRYWAGRPTAPMGGGLSEAGLREVLRGLRAGEITVGEARTRIQL